jgi:hypothetical protein
MIFPEEVDFRGLFKGKIYLHGYSQLVASILKDFTVDC